MFKKQMRMTRALPYEMSGPEVCHPTEQVEDAVPHGDQRHPAEDDRLGAVRGLRELGEHDARDAGLGSTAYSSSYCVDISISYR